MDFIEEIAGYVQKYAPKYNIRVCSPIIAQAILESGHGKSELAVNANNYFGLKYKKGRCPSASGTYYKIGSEQNPDGSYVDSMMKWCRFDDMESCVVGYFDFINIPRYENLKGVTDCEKYIELIKSDGYATSINYIDNLKRVVKEYDLKKYDKEAIQMKTIALSAGHGLYTAGKRCMKSLDPNETREWFLNDRIQDKVEQKLKQYECRVVRVNDTTGREDTKLSERARISNEVKADLYISVHHNAGAHGGNGGGVTVFYWSSNPERKEQAMRLYKDIIAQTGLSGNRYYKTKKKYYYECRKPLAPAFLIENGFMDSRIDTPIILTEEYAEKSAVGIVNFIVSELNIYKNGEARPEPKPEPKPDPDQNDSTVHPIGYNLVFDYKYYANKYADLRHAYGFDKNALFNHFKQYGMKEGRQAIKTFDVNFYKNQYADLRAAFGNDLPKYYKHYIEYGHKEGRKAWSQS